MPSPRHGEAGATNPGCTGQLARSHKHPDATATLRRSAALAYAGQEIPLAYGELFSPYGRRHLWSLIVRRCPNCRHMHIHKIGNPSAESWIKTGSCGRDYRVVVRPVQRTVGRSAA
jgi:hypothetical protein